MSEVPHGFDVELLLTEAGWVNGLVMQLLSNAEDAEDVLQDTWVAALESGGEVSRRRGASGLRSWLAAVARNLALRSRQREAARRHHEPRAAHHDDPEAPGDGLERMQMQQLLAEQLLALEEPYRTSVILRYLDGLRHRAIAERQGISEAAARQRVSRGIATLRARLEHKLNREGKNWIQALLAVFPQGEPAPSAGLWIGGVLMGAKGIAVVAAAVGAIGLLLWSTLGARPEEEALTWVVGPASPGEPLPAVQALAVPSGEEAETTVRRSVPTRTQPDSDDALGNVRVTDRAGRPLAGAWLRRVDAPPDEVASVTDEQGRAHPPLGGTVEEFRGGETSVELIVGCGGYVDSSVIVALLNPVEVTLLALPEVHGQLLDPGGLPVTRRGLVRIGVLSESSGALEDLRVELDGAGGFRFTGVPRGQLRWIKGIAEGFVETEHELDLVLGPEHAERVDLTLAVGAVVEGIVLDATTEEPLSGAFVWTGDFFWDESDLTPHTTTDQLGRFRLEGHDIRNHYDHDEEGRRVTTRLLIFARTETHAPAQEWVSRPWREDAHYDVVLRLNPTACVVTGIVSEPGGERPAIFVGVLAIDASGNTHTTVTTAAGRFRFEGLPPGSLDIFCRRGDLKGDALCQSVAYHLDLKSARSEEVALELVESEQSHIAGRLVDSEDGPVVGVTIHIQWLFRHGAMTIGPLSSKETVTNEDGRFAFESFPPGYYVLRPRLSQTETSHPVRHELVLAREEVSDGWDFVVGSSATFAGSITTDTRGALSLRLVLVDPSSEEELESTRPDAEGRFLFGPVPAGRYEIHVIDGIEVLEILSVGPDGTENIQIYLR